MGKYMRKCKGIGEIAVMEVGPLTRARTLALAAASGKRRKVGAAVDLPLRGRRVPTTDQKPVSSRKSPGSARVAADRCPSADRIVTSRCSSHGSCDQTTLERLRSADFDQAGSGEGLDDSLHNLEYSAERRRETTPSSNLRADYDDLDSTTAPSSDSNSDRKPPAPKMPSEAEIEDFFAAAENHEHKRFVEKYNFDVKKDAPLEGRYEWVRLK